MVEELIERIKKLIKNNTNSAALARNVGVTRQVIDKYKKGESKFKNMTAENLIKFEEYFKEMDKMEKEILILVEAGEDYNNVEFFQNFEELKQHLNQTDYFGWITDQEPETEVPDFYEVEDIADIKATFQEYDYSWWTMKLIEVTLQDLVEAVTATYDNNGNADIMLEVDDQELIIKDVAFEDSDLDETGQDFKASFYREAIQEAIENKNLEIVE